MPNAVENQPNRPLGGSERVEPQEGGSRDVPSATAATPRIETQLERSPFDPHPLDRIEEGATQSANP